MPTAPPRTSASSSAGKKRRNPWKPRPLRGFCYLLNLFRLHWHPAAADHGGMNAQASHPPRSPRDWAAAILAEPSRERRNQLLARCPAHWRDMVREHVASAFARVQQYRQHKIARTESARQRPPAAPRREDTSFRVSDFPKSAPEIGRARLAELRATLGATP